MKKIIVTAGGTSENIDSVRSITNFSTGKTGASIAEKMALECYDEIEKIYYVCSKTAVLPKLNDKIEIVKISGVIELEKCLKNILNENDIFAVIHAMAVSDYTIDYVSSSEKLAIEIFEKIDTIKSIDDIKNIIDKNKNILINNKKISSSEEDLILKLKKAPKVIRIFKEISPNTILISFKLLDKVSEKELINVAKKQMEKNNCDYVIANDLSKMNEENHKAIMIDKIGSKVYLENNEEIALEIVKTIGKK